MSQLLSERLRALSEKEAPPDVVVVALPNEVREAAGGGRNPRRHAASRTSKRQDGQLRLAFMDEPEAETEPESRTLHRAIKAEGMRWSLCTQLAWPATFSGGDTVEDDATRAWNFCTGLYYKAGGVPWRVSGLGKNTCYVGISFFRPLGRERTLQTSLAQAFADRGDGIILRGESFEWDLRKQGSPHLSKESACRLLKDVLDAYTRHHRQRPVRVVVHKSSDFDEGEIEGLKDALGGHVPYYDFLSIGKSSTRFMRVGHEPPLRGTVIEVAPKEYVFYTRGYVPFLKVYPGLRVPRPLAVRHCEGSAPVTELLAEILALTKLNWNSSAFGASEPITLHFARDVGLILSELPEGIQPKELYRYYM